MAACVWRERWTSGPTAPTSYGIPPSAAESARSSRNERAPRDIRGPLGPAAWLFSHTVWQRGAGAVWLAAWRPETSGYFLFAVNAAMMMAYVLDFERSIVQPESIPDDGCTPYRSSTLRVCSRRLLGRARKE